MKANTNLKAGLLQGEPVRSSCRKLGSILLLLVIAALPSWAQNDTYFKLQWGLSNFGQTVNPANSGTAGTYGSSIHATQAWELSTGSSKIVVAVIDNGIDYNHPDLQNNIWRAPQPFTFFSLAAGTRIAQIDCQAGTPGINLIDYNCEPIEQSSTSSESHGTPVAGIIGAVGDNRQGVVGVNWNANIMAVKTGATATEIAEGIRFAVEMKRLYDKSGGTQGANVRVINISSGYFGSPLFDSVLPRIYEANANNILVVASAGNAGDGGPNGPNNNDLNRHYPSGYNSEPNVVSVAATNNTDSLASVSNFGAKSVDLAAPGDNVLSTIPHTVLGKIDSPEADKPGYAYQTGTSFAAPFVSGAAALILSACDVDAASLKKLILDNVDPIPSLYGKTVAPPGHPNAGGRLDVNKAIRACALGHMTSPPPETTLSSSSVTFSWGSAIGVTNYWLYVGRSWGKADLFNSNQPTTSLSVTVPNLPTDGSPIYVRLYSQLRNGAWHFNDYTYQAVGGDGAAVITSPVNNSTSRPSMTFKWTQATVSTYYMLWVGTTPGHGEIYAGDFSTNRSATVNLPTDGTTSTIYVRLWSGDSFSIYRDYTYRVVSPTAAEIISPLPGSTSRSPSVTFNWSNGIGVTQYFLSVGRTPGGTEIYGEYRNGKRPLWATVPASPTAPRLPTDGSPIYVRLYSQLSNGLNSQWFYREYIY